jgi:exodeoxyribonuclease VII large subunit
MPDLFSQPDDAPWTPTLLARAARRVLEGGIGPLWLRAELSGLKVYQSGHWYFTLRDAGAQIRAVMWRKQAMRVQTPPPDGTQVFVFGTPTVWEERGEFRFTVTDLLVTDQVGKQQRELERVRRLLERDGLFDATRKRPLPALPQRVAVVTSLDGAALHDIITVARRRWPAVELFVVGARVQGAEAAADLVQALRLVNRIEGLDLCVVGRGGGGREDLHIFNNEAVCRALAAVRVPTISAVGHETDVSLTDFVADVRAPTPSAAIEMAIPDRADLARRVAGLGLRLAGSLGRGTRLARERLARAADRLEGSLERRLSEPRRALELLAAQLDALSPLRVLDRGYSVARDGDGRVLRRVEQFTPGLGFGLRVSDGDVRARVDPR